MQDFHTLIIEILKYIPVSSNISGLGFSIKTPILVPRTLYVFFSLVNNGLSNFNLTKPTVNYTPIKLSSTIKYQENWRLFFIQYAFNKLNSNFFNNNFNVSFLPGIFPGMNNSMYQQFLRMFKLPIGSLTKSLDAFYTTLDNDGWKVMNSHTSNDLPNKTSFIDRDNVQDINSFIKPDQWTPIKINGIVQKPLHIKAKNVSSLLSQATISSLQQELNGFFNKITDQERDKEYRNVYDMSLNLTDEQKVIAEYWAGGPGTLTPPGYWNLFAWICCTNKNTDFFQTTKLFTVLNASLYQGGLLAWTLKYNLFEERPIQHIRRTIDESISNFYFPDITSSKLWLPYQEKDFVTPPFPDFVSGHSTFSSIGATILQTYFGDDLLELNLKVEGSLMKLVCPLFNNECEATVELSCVNIYPKTSTINSSYPTKMVSLRFDSWSDMSLQAGLSRIYGGIHIQSSNYSGYIVGERVAREMMKVM